MRKRGFLHLVFLFLASVTAMAQPGEVTLIAPADNSASVAVLPMFVWHPASGAVSYEIQVARRANMKQIEVDAVGISDSSYVLKTALNESQTYFWRVRAIGDANGPWSNVWSFTTGLLPDDPSPASPADQETGVSLTPELVWLEANGATSYAVELSTEPDFTTLIYDQMDIVGTSLVLPIQLDTETRYYWHVRGSNEVGDGPFSTARWFETVVSAPDQVVLSSPADGATGIVTTPTFTWESATGADTYSIEVSESSDFATLLLEMPGLTSTSFDVSTPFANGTVLYWRVRATNGAGDGPDSIVRHFTTIAGGPTQVILTSPANGSADIDPSPDLAWEAVQDASSYRVQVGKVANFSSEITYDTVVGGTQLKIGPLEFGETYYWRVRASNAGSENWSDVASFATTTGLPGQVMLDLPLDGAVDQPLAPTLTWTAPIRAETYNLEVGLDSAFAVVLLSEKGITTTGRVLDALDAETEYYWHVQAENGVGTGPWSSARSFTTRTLLTPAVPVLIYPPDAAAGISVNPVFAWNETEGADSYKLELSTSPPDEFENFATVITAVVITQPFFQSPELSPGQEHYWRVEARNTDGSTPSAVWRFRTAVATSAESEVLPEHFSLHQNYPNPFNPATTIRYDVPETAGVRLTVFDAMGRTVETLGTWHRTPGTYSVQWEAGDAPSGAYFVRMEAGTYVATRRMLLIR